VTTPPKYVVGIDLGTTNCALAFAPLAEGPEASARDFEIPQLQRPAQVGRQSLLPSFVYSAGEHELDPTARQLPWGEAPAMIVGEMARWQGARIPGRLIASAKSWLCHMGVDRTAPILPWGAPAEVARLSPTDASAALLHHLGRAWDHEHPEAPLAQQDVVITVPASFDEVARALTVTAAQRAGLQTFSLLEEPQAAFYDFTARHRDALGAALRDVRLVLVIDVGGGTSDFTLVHAAAGDEGPVLKRIAVGEHLLLGGDNMDATLARRLEERMVAGGRRLSAVQWTQLLQAARGAKEQLLSVEGVERQAVSLASEGSRMLGQTFSAEVTRGEAETLILDGFLPRVGSDERPRRSPARAALQELGLPYAPDPAITRHLAAFLHEHAPAARAVVGGAEAELPRPDAILLNGGVFNSAVLTARLIDAVSAWWPKAPPVPLLKHQSLDLAVSRGAAYYGLVRRGWGRRIGGGAAHALYLGVAGDAQADDAKMVCVLPRGHDEGQTVMLQQRRFALSLGRPVQFPLYSTTSDRVDRPGDLVVADDTFKPLPPLHALLRARTGRTGVVSVHLQSSLTELGTLELSCVADEGDDRWRLEFDLRGSVRRAGETVVESMPARFSEVRTIIERIFGGAPQSVDPKAVRQLRGSLESALGPRDQWSLPLLRELWGSLFAGANRRRRSVEHERVFFQLLGYSLRPGWGYPLDDWRCEQTFRLWGEGVNARTETSVWREYWIMWRRIAAGLDESQQQEMWKGLRPHLARQVPPKAKNAAKPKGPQPSGIDEMVRTAASLELISPTEKEQFGHWLITRLQEAELRNGPWAWALGRVGARAAVSGGGHCTIDPDIAAKWIRRLLEIGLARIEGGAFAAVSLARMTGDRARDLDAETRAAVVTALEAANAPERWLQLVQHVVALEQADEDRMLGDALPIGLRL
jgi:molecular chaperone DnaK (HSP70)